MLGQRICELRCALGWSQVELAKRLSVAKQFHGRYQIGRFIDAIRRGWGEFPGRAVITSIWDYSVPPAATGTGTGCRITRK